MTIGFRGRRDRQQRRPPERCRGKVQQKKERAKQSAWNAAEDASSHTEIVKSPPRTEPTRLKGACTRTVQSCTLRKDGATVHSNRILLRVVAWATIEGDDDKCVDADGKASFATGTVAGATSFERTAVAGSCGAQSSRSITETVLVNWYAHAINCAVTHLKTASDPQQHGGKRQHLAPHEDCHPKRSDPGRAS